MRKHKVIYHRGPYAGLSGPWVASLMGCSYYIFKKKIKQKLIELNRELIDLSQDEQENLIGQLICEYRFKKQDSNISDFLTIMSRM